MNKLLRTVTLIAAAGLLLAGCAAASRTAQEDAGVHAVAVVSLLNEVAPVRRLGFTAFGNDQSSIDQGGKLKQVVDDAVTGRLKATRPQWTVKTGALDAAGMRRRSAEANTAALADLARRLDVDQLFVLEESMGENLPGQGVGLTFRTMGNTAGPTMVHAYVKLVVLDRSGKTLVVRGATRNNPQMTPPAELGVRPDLSNLGDPAVRDKVSQALQRRLAEAVDEAMTRAGY